MTEYFRTATVLPYPIADFHISYFAALFKMSESRLYAQKITQKKGKGKENFSIPRACTPGQKPGLNTLDAGRRVGVGQGDREFRIETIGKKMEKP